MSSKQLFIKIANPLATEYYQSVKTKHEGDSGIDLYILEDVEFYPGETKLIDLGIQTMVMTNELATQSYYLYPRSSISKTPLRLANSVGIIDAGYRGNLMGAFTYVPTKDDLTRLLSVGSMECYPPYVVKKGTRLLQICSNDLSPFANIEVVNELNETSRGEGGFGSTGI